MAPADERQHFIPLQNVDVVDIELGAFTQKNDAEDLNFKSISRFSHFQRPLIWAISSAVAVYTTKVLMITYGYHYPFTIAFRSFFAILILYVATLWIGSDTESTEATPKWGLRMLADNENQGTNNWAVMIPASVAAALSFPLLLQGLLHMPSLPVLVMLFPVIYAAESLVLFICCSSSRSRKWLPIEAIVSVIACSIVLYNEYRLMVPGIVSGVTGLLFTGLARACFVVASERSGSELAIQSRLRSYHAFVLMTLLIGTIMNGLFAALYEKVQDSHHPLVLPNHTIVAVIINTAAIIATAFSGCSILAYSPISFEDTKVQFSNTPLRATDLVASAASSLLVLLAAIHTSPKSYVSWIQISAYLVATISLAGAEQLHQYVLTWTEATQQQINKSFGSNRDTESRKPSKILTFGSISLLFIIFSYTLSTLSTLSLVSLPQGQSTTLDLQYKSAEKFDIVVSMYQEDPTAVKHMLQQIKATTYLSTIVPNIIIYTKDPKTDLSNLKKMTGANSVHRLDNVGREGATYLWHITNNWDNLAAQTLFIQAHAHNMRELIPRLNSYLVPQSGMLSLGFTGVTCDCTSCSDRWGWEDTWNVIPTLYERIYGSACTSDQKILLAYKGQFVASAKRIRGVKKENYEKLLESISTKAEWGNSSMAMDHKELGGVAGSQDTLDNPVFGFAVERIWSLLMQCATDAGIAAKCPSLLSGMGRGGKLEDCQCLD